MKIAILFRGPIRPSVDSVDFYINYLLDQFKGYDYETFFITWNDKNSGELIKKGTIDNIFLFKEPDIDFISNKLKTKSKYEGSMFERSYKMFWSQKVLFDIVDYTNKKFDYVVISRPDILIDIKNLQECFNKNAYIFPVDKKFLIQKKYNKEPLEIDVFTIGPYEIVKKVWDYGNLLKLNKLYGNSYGNGNMLKNMVKLAGVKYDYGEINYVLDKKRHYKDKEYHFRYRVILFNIFIAPITNLFGQEFTNKVANFIRKIFPAKAKDFRNK